MSYSSIHREDFDQYIVPVYAPAPFIPVKGLGSTIWDQQGKEYIDFTGGIAVNALGHAHPAVKAALVEQADQLWHIGNGYTTEPVLALAREMIAATFADKVFFCNSGAEANEAALKLARKYGRDLGGADKCDIIAFSNSFHGRTLFTVTAGGQPKYSEEFAPLPGAIHHVPFNDLTAVRELISDKTCAVIVEPVQGEGGIIPAQPEFLQGLRQLCDQHRAVLIFDEVQTGVGRTGTLYAYMQYGVVPDILSTAKALGGGFPIGAILTTNALAHAFHPGSHGTTYGGNPLATAVAGKVFSIINTPAVLDGVQVRHQWFMQTLNTLNQVYPVFEEFRGLGLLLGCQLKPEYAGQAKALANLAAEEGLLVLIAGPDVIRFAPALIIDEADVQKGLARFGKALARFLHV